MRLTIIPSDGKVNVDNEFFEFLDLSSCNVPENIHALQWYESSGEIEFLNNPDRTKPLNEVITSLPDWANACVTVWSETKAANEAAALAKQAAANQPQSSGVQSA